MDGIDAALLLTDGKKYAKALASCSLPYDKEFKEALRTTENECRKAKKNVAPAELIQKSTELHAEIVEKLLKKAFLSAQDIDLIGYHGQSVYHNSQEKITIQLGDGQLLATLTKIKVINDFRSQDIINFGQGAPLAPIYHQALAAKLNYYPIAFVNCGGIANISLVKGEEEDQLIGFDSGPGNALIDLYIRSRTNNLEFMDQDGKYGKKGILNQEILEMLKAQLSDFLAKPAPKSLDPSDFYLPKEIECLSIFDACRTLEAFTAYCIINSLPNLPKKWVLSGGGWNNPVIVEYLHKYLAKELDDFEVYSASELGFSSTYMEAELFAYLAARSFYKLPISFPSVTGCKKPTLGGKLYTPQINGGSK